MSTSNNLSQNVAVQKRLESMPQSYRRTYATAMNGNSRKAAMRAQCLECVGWNSQEIIRCTDCGCPLFPYRFKG